MRKQKDDIIKDTARARMKGKTVFLSAVCFICDIGFILSAAAAAALGAANILKKTEIYIVVPIATAMTAISFMIRFITSNYKRKKFSEAYSMNKKKTNDGKIGRKEIKYLFLSAFKGLYKLILPAVAVLGIINICYKIQSDLYSGIVAFFGTVTVAAIIEYLNLYFYMKVTAVKMQKAQEKEVDGSEEGVSEQ